jgi:hypothetical protein
MPPINSITILGGGLTGLTVAYRLSRLLKTLPALTPQTDHARAHRDTKITLLEKSDRIGGWVHSSSRTVQVPRTSESQDGEKGDEVINVDITLEAGPRSIRPKGSIGAAYMLKMVSILHTIPLTITNSAYAISDSRPLARILHPLRLTHPSIGAEPIHPLPRDRSSRSPPIWLARCNGHSDKW